MKTLRILPLIVAALTLAGCAGESSETEATTTTTQPLAPRLTTTNPTPAESFTVSDEDSEAARDRLEKQGIIYSDGDWGTLTRKICTVDKPDLYMGIDGTLQKYRDEMTSSEKYGATVGSMGSGEAPNSDQLTNREKIMVLDVVTDDVC